MPHTSWQSGDSPGVFDVDTIRVTAAVRAHCVIWCYLSAVHKLNSTLISCRASWSPTSSDTAPAFTLTSLIVAIFCYISGKRSVFPWRESQDVHSLTGCTEGSLHLIDKKTRVSAQNVWFHFDVRSQGLFFTSAALQVFWKQMNHDYNNWITQITKRHIFYFACLTHLLPVSRSALGLGDMMTLWDECVYCLRFCSTIYTTLSKYSVSGMCRIFASVFFLVFIRQKQTCSYFIYEWQTAQYIRNYIHIERFGTSLIYVQCHKSSCNQSLSFY